MKEASACKVFPQPFYFRFGEIQASRLDHIGIGITEQTIIHDVDHIGICSDAKIRQAMNSAEEFAIGAGIVHSPAVALNRKEISSTEFRTDEARCHTTPITAVAILGVCQPSEKVFG